MTYSAKVKETARKLRNEGGSINDISAELSVAKSTISLWVRDVELPKAILAKMQQYEIAGRTRGLSAIAARRDLDDQLILKYAGEMWSQLDLFDNKDFWKICAALLFWCEGAKRLSNMMFSNSDPEMVSLYMKALRKGFDINENKFSVQLHLHEYHDVEKQVAYWSKLMGIPVNQFNKPYIKPHTGKRKREGYPGCVSLRYGEARLARKLSAIYHVFVKNT